MNYEILELCRFQDPEQAAEVKRLLKEGGIPFRESSAQQAFDVASMGTSPTTPYVIVSVIERDFEKARALMEAEMLGAELPEDHFLVDATDEELAEMLGNPHDWSPFDVAHARRIAQKRGVDDSLIKSMRIEAEQKRRAGKPAPIKYLIMGWAATFGLAAFFPFLGLVSPMIGIGIGWSLMCLQNKTADGVYYVYDERSRQTGKVMLVVALAMFAGFVMLMLAGKVMGA